MHIRPRGAPARELLELGASRAENALVDLPQHRRAPDAADKVEEVDLPAARAAEQVLAGGAARPAHALWADVVKRERQLFVRPHHVAANRRGHVIPRAVQRPPKLRLPRDGEVERVLLREVAEAVQHARGALGDALVREGGEVGRKPERARAPRGRAGRRH